MPVTVKSRPPASCSGIQTGGWQIVYTGFVLIMLTFFILLSSFASLESSRITRFVSSFSNAVNVLEKGQSVEESKMLIGQGVNDPAKEDLRGQLFENVRRIALEENLDPAELERAEHGVVMTLKESLLFASAKADLNPEAFPRLEKIASLIERIGVPVEIRGHTDDRPIRNALFSSNWELSTARAVSVLRCLIERHKVDPRRLTAVGLAEFQSLAGNDSPAQRAMNRRVEFVFLVNR